MLFSINPSIFRIIFFCILKTIVALDDPQNFLKLSDLTSSCFINFCKWVFAMSCPARSVRFYCIIVSIAVASSRRFLFCLLWIIKNTFLLINTLYFQQQKINVISNISRNKNTKKNNYC